MTENLTCRGFFCLSDESYLPGDELQATLEVPAPCWNGRRRDGFFVQCQVEVVRLKGRQSGIGCRIKDYTVIADPQAELKYF
jgi:hypothetical protein